MQKNRKEKIFLNCTVNWEEKCPLIDNYSLTIKEINNSEVIFSSKQNTIYLKNFINRNKITIEAGEMAFKKCDGNNYHIYINISNISNIQGNMIDSILNTNIEFQLKLNHPNKLDVKCNLSITNRDGINEKIDCVIKGKNHCLIFDDYYLEIEEEPIPNSSFPLIKYSNFKKKRLYFNNFYINISKTNNCACQGDIYKFDLIFESENKTKVDYFEINLKGDLEQNYIANYTIIKGLEPQNNSLIHCEI